MNVFVLYDLAYYRANLPVPLDGTIGRKNSYGNDPNPPKDKNR